MTTPFVSSQMIIRERGESQSETWVASNDIEEFYEEVEGRRNILHDYNTYNYIFTLTSLSKEQYENPSSYQNGVLNNGAESGDFYIVAKSGGFTRNNTSSGSSLAGDAGGEYPSRQNDLRDKDLYIENVEFTTVAGYSGIGNSNLARGTFEIFEPYGVTGAYEQLYHAAREAGYPNYIGAPFLFVIDFIGRKRDLNSGPEKVPKSTRYIPIKIAKSEMRVEAGGTRYTFEFSGFTTISGMTSQIYGVTPKDISSPTKGDQIDAPHFQTPMADRLNSGVVLYDFFRKLNFQSQEKYKEFFTTYQEETSSNQPTPEVVAQRAEFANQSASAAGVDILTESQARTGQAANKYCIWWPEDYARAGESGQDALDNLESGSSGGVSFPSDLAQIQYNTYDGNAVDFLNSGFGTAPYSNPLAMKTMITEALARTGNRTIESVQSNIESLNTQIEDQERLINDKKGVIRGFKTQAQTRVTAIIQELKLLGVIDDDDSLEGDFNKSVEEGTNDAFATGLNDFIQGALNAQAQVTNEQPRQNLVRINQLLLELTGIRDEFTTAKQQLEEYETQLTNLQRERETERNTPRQFYTGTPVWQWKEGIMVKQVIQNVMLESDLVNDLNRPETLRMIRQTEYVDWFIVHEIAKPIGFDPYKLDFQYQFNYFVQPYKIHYSQIPGLNIAFSYEESRKKAVREYNYIYTGKNVDVLEYDIVYNNLFSTPNLFSQADHKPLQLSEHSEELTDNTRTLTGYAQALDQLQNNLVGTGIVTMPNRSNRPTHIPLPVSPNEAALGFQDFLLRPVSDQALVQAKIKIIGDPVYVIGSGIGDRPTLTFDDIETSLGEVNVFSREADLIFNFGFAEDYPNAEERNSGNSQPGTRSNRYSGLYKIARIQNYFQDGVFTQVIETNRRPNQPSDYVTYQRATDPVLTDETVIEGSAPDEIGNQEQGSPVVTEGNAGGTRVVNPDDANPRATNPRGVQTRIINAISQRTGEDAATVALNIQSKVQDNRLTSAAGGLSGEPTTEEVVAAAIELYPAQFPSIPSGPEGVAQALSRLNQPLPTQDQLQNRLATPGEPRPDILTVINQGLEFSSRYVRAESIVGGSLGDSRPGAVLIQRGSSAFDGGFEALNDTAKYELDNLSADLGFPILVNSAVRSSAQQQALRDQGVTGAASASTGPHVTRQDAVDISTVGLSTAQVNELIQTASRNGWNAIGTYETHVHLDRRDNLASWDHTQGNQYGSILQQHRRGDFQ